MGDNNAAQITSPFDLAAIAIGAGVEIDAIETERQCRGVQFIAERAVISDRCRSQHRPVLQIVGTGVAIPRIVRCDAIGANIDAESGVGVNRITANYVPRSGSRLDSDTIAFSSAPAVSGDHIAFTSADATHDRIERAVFDQNPMGSISPGKGFGRIGSNEVALDDGA